MSATQRLHSRKARDYTGTITVNGVELDVDYTCDDGVLYIDRLLSCRGDDLSGLIEILDNNGHLTSLVTDLWEQT
jgi:hypothetical protein